MKISKTVGFLLVLCIVSSSYASWPFNTMKKAEKLVTTCMVDCFDNCPQEIIILMLEKCEKSCMNGQFLFLMDINHAVL